MGTQDEDEIRKMEENTKKGTVADGTYVPSFGFTGGTGKVTISCPKLVVKNGKGTATIVFSSKKISYIVVNGTTYYNENSGGSSTFTIPVNINGTTAISALTTAMSTPHLVDYTLYIYVDGTDVSSVTPSSTSNRSEDADAGDAEDKAETAEDEDEEDMADGGKSAAGGWGDFDSDQTTDEVPTDGAAAPAEPETGEPTLEPVKDRKKFPAAAVVGICVVAVGGLTAAVTAAERKKKARR